ncbi:MAG: hypothetical protein E6K70_25900 [Planctomycetota bacterium]|nr:MAG: hypothetical protein E6K70_25900 [Planctomycetota bacterium]
MRWLHAEYILKGTYLGLLLFAALAEPDWISLGVVALLALGGLAIALGVAAFQKMRAGYRAAGKFLPFLAFLILESPILVYAGIVGGMAAGAAFLCKDLTDVRLLAILAMAGAALGIVFWLLRTVRQRWYRVGLSLLLATGLAAAALFFLGKLGEFGGPTN